MSERHTFTVLGRDIGTATGWDQQDTHVVIFYDLEPFYEINLPKGDVEFDSENGYFIAYDENGDLVGEKLDVISVLSNTSRKE